MEQPIRPLDKEKMRRLIETSRFARPATMWIRNGRVLNVYSGELLKANVVICEDRIAYVGDKEPLVDENSQIIDAEGRVLVPGYIEPHAHPSQLYNFATLGQFALSRGTTLLLMDNLSLYLQMEPNDLLALVKETENWPIKYFWWLSLDAHNNLPEMMARYTPDRLEQLIAHPNFLQAGELTTWPQLLRGQEPVFSGTHLARSRGKRIEGHHPGASAETLNAVAAAGITACHESITAEEIARRLRVGMYASLRHSSIRPDVPDLVKGLLQMGLASSPRLMMTSDGSTPPFHEHGFTDFLLKTAMEAGLPPVDAYRMASLNVAVYYGMDHEVGGIAPGRIADICLLAELEQPAPLMVISDGKIVAEHGELTVPFPEFDWRKYGLYTGRTGSAEENGGEGEARPDWFAIEGGEQGTSGELPDFPVIELVNSVITKESRETLPLRNGVVDLAQLDYLYASLLDRNGKWAANSVVKGFARVDALCSSYSSYPGYVVLGSNREAMGEAVNRCKRMGGGIVLLEKGEVLFELPLPISNMMSTLSMNELIAESKKLVMLLRERGFTHLDPLYTLFFLGTLHLPSLRLSYEGVYAVKEQRVVWPVKRLR